MTPLESRTQSYVEWINALRSGKYHQTKRVLRTKSSNTAFCCLGVVCDLAINNGQGKWELDRDVMWAKLDNGAESEYNCLPSSLRDHLGLAQSDLTMLVSMNDILSNTFDEIANHIESTIMPTACDELTT